MNFTLILLHWYGKNKRNLPWRNTTNPYYIWLSEIILQQTRVAQGLPYYQAFTENFPTIKDLATAHEDAVLKLWQGLGYYSRARNLHATAKKIHFDLDNKFPTTYSEILELKGIGPYTAAAIASFAFKEPVGVVDGNVYRVLARFFGMFDDISLPKTRTIFQEMVNTLISKEHPDLFNHALMDFGATVCTPTNPNCTSCPLSDGCYAFLEQKIIELPVKTKKLKVKNRYFHYLLIKNNNSLLIQQRQEKDIWQKLYQPLLIETKENNEEAFLEQFNLQFPQKSIKKVTNNDIKHKLSHQQLFINFYEIEEKIEYNDSLEIPITHLDKYAYPIVIWNFLKDYFQLEKN